MSIAAQGLERVKNAVSLRASTCGSWLSGSSGASRGSQRHAGHLLLSHHPSLVLEAFALAAVLTLCSPVLPSWRQPRALEPQASEPEDSELLASKPLASEPLASKPLASKPLAS